MSSERTADCATPGTACPVRSDSPRHSSTAHCVTQDTSLTAPWDLSKKKAKYVPKQVTLKEDEVAEAMDTLCVSDFVEKFPRVDKFYADPVLNSQVYCLHSFVPTKGATPDEHGVYGFVKFRGAFATQEEADERAEYIIRNVDSFHEIYTSYCGRPFPLSHNKDFVKETAEVEIRDQIVKATSQDVAAKVRKDKSLKEEIMDKEKKLLEDVQSEESPVDRYTTLQVKRANLVHVYIENKKKLDQVRDALLKARAEIKAMDDADPRHRVEYMDKYNNARKQSGLDVCLDNTYLQYMGVNDEELLGF